MWLDALVNYYTVLGYPANGPTQDDVFKEIIHVIGKDILRFHTLMWPAFLLANGYPLPREVVVHNFWLLRSVPEMGMMIR